MFSSVVDSRLFRLARLLHLLSLAIPMAERWQTRKSRDPSHLIEDLIYVYQQWQTRRNIHRLHCPR